MTPRDKVAALILAAGQGLRFGACKQLALIDGRPMLQIVLDTVLACPFAQVFVVLGFAADRIETALDLGAAKCVLNPDYHSGLSTSLRAGIKAAPDDVSGVMVFLGDMPLVAKAHVQAVLDAHTRKPDHFVLPMRGSAKGHPVFIPKASFADVLTLTGDVGARSLLAAAPEKVVRVQLDDTAVIVDVDTPVDLARLAPRP